MRHVAEAMFSDIAVFIVKQFALLALGKRVLGNALIGQRIVEILNAYVANIFNHIARNIDRTNNNGCCAVTHKKQYLSITKKGLIAQAFLVGVPRFELGTPCSQSRCANRTALHPDCVELFSFCGAKILHFFDSTTKLPQLFAILCIFHRLPVLFHPFFQELFDKEQNCLLQETRFFTP